MPREDGGEFGLECEVLDRDAMEKLGMGSLLGVAIGSAEPPVLIVLRYRPANVQGNAHLGRWARELPSIPAVFPSSPRTAWRK